jgi:hypothetical protein
MTRGGEVLDGFALAAAKPEPAVTTAMTSAGVAASAAQYGQRRLRVRRVRICPPFDPLVRGGRARWFLFGARSKPLQMECLHFGRDLLIPFPVAAEDQSRGTELGTDLST